MHTQATKDKISKTLTGHPMTEKALGALRENTPFKKGFTPWNKGKSWPEEIKRRISETNKRKGIEPRAKFVGFGEDHPRWKGGIVNERFHDKKRRAREFNAEGSHTEGDWETLKAQYNWTCPCCKRKEPESMLTEDHIIPLSRGGSHNIENIQPLCRSCNASKNNRHFTKYTNEQS
jgi:hypothetical protein